MKKFCISFVAFVLILIIIATILWFNIPAFVAKFLSKEFKVSVSVGNINVTRNHLNINDLDIGTPEGSKTKSSFFSKEINFNTDLLKLKKETLVIDSIIMNNNIIGIEFYNSSGSDNNWGRILSSPTISKKPSKKKYLIKTLVLYNVTVVLTYQNGKKQTLPTIEKLEFQDISNETGFPIGEMEKAISQAVLKEALGKFNLLRLLQTPEKIIKKVLPFPLKR